MKIMKISIQQIAADVGTSPATVSRVMNRQPGVNAELRQQIIAAAHRLGYRRRLGPGSDSIAVIVPGDEELDLRGYLSHLITGLTSTIFKAGYHLQLLPYRDLELLKTEVAAGAISTLFVDGIEREWGRRYPMPLVCINTSGYHLDHVYAVCSNERQGMRLAVNHLVQHGHRKIGLLLTGAVDTWCNRERSGGFQDAITAAGAEGIAESAMADVYGSLGELVRRKVTAVICTGENSGIHVAYALHSFGYRIPEDMSLIVHELEGVSPYCQPPLTTIRQNFRNLSQSAVKVLGNLIDGHTPSGDSLIDYELIVRETVAAPATAPRG